MKTKVISLALAAITVMLALFSGPASFTAYAANGTEQFIIKTDGISEYGEAQKVLELLNAYRTGKGLAPLRMDADLLESAMQRAAEVAVFYGHTRPNGTTCFTAFPQKFEYSGMAENIAIGYTSAAEVMNGWANSEGHNKNMLNGEYLSVGIGCFMSSDGCLSWVQLFCTGVSDAAASQSSPVAVTRSMEIAVSNFSPAIDGGTEHIGVGNVTAYYAVNHNINYKWTAPRVYFNYAVCGNPEVAEVWLTEDGFAAVRGLSPGIASLYIGFVPENVEGQAYLAKVELQVTSLIYGDVNDDQIVDNADAALILRYDAGLAYLYDGQMIAADVNVDGVVDNADAALILRYDAGLD